MEPNGKSPWRLYPEAAALLGQRVRIQLLDGSALEAPLMAAEFDKSWVEVGMAFAGHRHGIRYAEMESIRAIA